MTKIWSRKKGKLFGVKNEQKIVLKNKNFDVKKNFWCKKSKNFGEKSINFGGKKNKKLV